MDRQQQSMRLCSYLGGTLRVQIPGEELGLQMRGVEIVGTPLTSMNKIMAVGAETGVFNGYCGGESGWVPVSTVAPALLFREIEVQRTSQHRQRGPVLRRPATRQGVSR